MIEDLPVYKTIPRKLVFNEYSSSQSATPASSESSDDDSKDSDFYEKTTKTRKRKWKYDENNIDKQFIRGNNRSYKDQLIAAILCRWWYCLDEWPPINFNYADILKSRNLNLIPVEDLNPNKVKTDDGSVNCYELGNFPGVFRDLDGKIHDLRPEEGKPCYKNLNAKKIGDLQILLRKALETQIHELNAQKQSNDKIEDIKKDINLRFKLINKEINTNTYN